MKLELVIRAFAERYKEFKSPAETKEVIPYLHEWDAGPVNPVRRALGRVTRMKEGRNQL